MKKVSKKTISCFMLCALMMSSIMGFAINSNAASGDDYSNPDFYYVDSEKSLKEAIKKSKDGDSINFTEDITCKGDLRVSKSIVIIPNHHSLSFVEAKNGIVVLENKNVELWFGSIYGAEDSNSAINVRSGSVKLRYMNVFGGNCKNHDWLNYGNAIYCSSKTSVVDVYFSTIAGGNGYSKGIFNPSRTCKAIYGGTKVIGRYVKEIDGIYRQDMID